MTDLMSFLGHCDLYFTILWYCHITGNILRITDSSDTAFSLISVDRIVRIKAALIKAKRFQRRLQRIHVNEYFNKRRTSCGGPFSCSRCSRDVVNRGQYHDGVYVQYALVEFSLLVKSPMHI